MRRVGIVAQHVAATQNYDMIIRNGTVFDGLRTPRFVSDIGIVNGKVATIGRIAKDAACAKEIDATGKHVCPGFVDLHTHYDAQVFWDPYCTLSGWHGVTSVVIGNCGFGYAPCKPENRVRYMKSMERNEAVPYEAQEKGMPWDWESFPEFLDSLERTPKGINLLSYMGLNPLMIHVMGIENAKGRGSNSEEMAEMKRLLREAMDAGACGFSAQILGKTSVQRDYDGTPMVTDTMSKEDLYAFGSVLSELGRGFMQVTGPSIKTTENLAKASGRPIIYNAVTPSVDQHGEARGGARPIMKWLEEANQEKGLRIFGQAITAMGVEVAQTFQLSNYNLFDRDPAWREMMLGTPEERIVKMQDPKFRQGALTLQERGKTNSRLGLNIGNLIYKKSNSGKEENKKWEGMQAKDIATARNQPLIEAFIDVSCEDGLLNEWQTAINPVNIDELKLVANHPYCVPGVSDGGAHTKFITAGEYSTEFIAGLVRDNDGMSLEDAHWRMSKYPAQAAGMLDRGSIAVGMPADILIYNYESLKLGKEEIAYDFPGGEWRRIKRAEGYDYTIVNGVITFEGLRCTGATPGRLLRHGRAD